MWVWKLSLGTYCDLKAGSMHCVCMYMYNNYVHVYAWHCVCVCVCERLDCCRGVGRWFGKGGLYRSIGKSSMISVYKIESSYVKFYQKT